MYPVKIYQQGVSFAVYPNYIIAETSPYLEIGNTQVAILKKIVNKYFKGEFGLIEVRHEQVSIDPIIYKNFLSEIPNFTSFALVSKSRLAHHFFETETYLLHNVSRKLFIELQDAIKWTKSILAEAKKSPSL